MCLPGGNLTSLFIHKDLSIRFMLNFKGVQCCVFRTYQT